MCALQTPKYGLIYHASLIGQAPPKFKGKISRVLAAKCALSIRVDALGDTEDASVGLESRQKVRPASTSSLGSLLYKCTPGDSSWVVRKGLAGSAAQCYIPACLWQNPTAPMPGPCGFEPRRQQLVLDLRGQEGYRCTRPRIRTHIAPSPHHSHAPPQADPGASSLCIYHVVGATSLWR